MAETILSQSHNNEHHVTRRFFLGPLPEKVISSTEASSLKRRRKLGLFSSFGSSDADGEDAGSPNLLPDNFALRYYLRHGGKAEDWGDDQEERLRSELKRKWKETEWGKTWHQRHEARRTKNVQTTRWVGGSFEVGDVLGVNLLTAVPGSLSTYSKPSDEQQPPPSPATEAAPTTPMDFSPVTPNIGLQDGNNGQASTSSAQNSTSNLLGPSLSNLQGTSQLKMKTDSMLRRPILKLRATSSARVAVGTDDVSPKGKGKAVHYAESFGSDISSVIGAAPPSEVLERSGSDVLGTSAGATVDEPSTPAEEIAWGEVVMRDRMLVRVCYTRSESLGPIFDEACHRTTDGLQHQDWTEFMVVWRKHRLELYEDYRVPGKLWLTGHSHLSYIVPIMSSKTRLSMYSFVDMSFCITCPPTSIRQSRGSKTSAIFRREKEGTNVLIFNVKTRSRAVDWVWKLWRQIGNQLPPYVEIRNPRLDARIRIDIPFLDESRAKLLSRENLLALCTETLQSTPGRKNILARKVGHEGKTLQLGWRLGTHLDWLWLEDDIHGNERSWTVLFGLAMKQSSGAAQLEIRLAQHSPTLVHLPDGTRLPEPAAIEGYLSRIKPNTQTKFPVYLATHNGNLFSILPAKAHPPSPPGMEIHDTPPEILRESEVRRGGMQIMDALGVSDLRSIIIVRRAFSPHITHRHDERERDDNQWANLYTQVEGEDGEDRGDEGGDDGLSKVSDKVKTRVRRSFELLMKNGRVIRFEAHSCCVAIEWINRLRALVLYWRSRHREDAKDEMHLGESTRPLLTPHLHAHCVESSVPPEQPVDLKAPLPALGLLYNWCTVEGCKPIVRGGNVFIRKGLRGQYKAVQMFLVAGSLVFFNIKPHSALHPARSKVKLTDAYVSSGYFAALVLPSGQFNPNTPSLARRYQDGLEADDSEEDTLITIWYRSQAPVAEELKEKAPVPPLSAKRKTLLIRTRSRLERDAWCWALSVEIEKLSRAQKEREEQLRQTGSLVACF